MRDERTAGAAPPQAASHGAVQENLPSTSIEPCARWHQANRGRALLNVDYVNYFDGGAFRTRPAGIPARELFLVKPESAPGKR